MIQFNLLPDVKLEYIKAQRSRRLVLSISTLITVVSIGLFVIVFATGQFQKKHLNDLNHDIASQTSTLQSQSQLSKILTVQNQLGSITTLDDGKPATSRLFGYLDQITPSDVDITNYTSDFNADTVTITGTTNALSTINQFVDTLKFTTYAIKGSPATPAPMAFSNVVLSSFGLNSGSASSSGGSTSTTAASPNQAATYSVTFSYDPNIFNNTETVSLTVPKLITTRSEIAKPTDDLFTDAPVTSTTTAGSTATTTGGTH